MEEIKWFYKAKVDIKKAGEKLYYTLLDLGHTPNGREEFLNNFMRQKNHTKIEKSAIINYCVYLFATNTPSEWIVGEIDPEDKEEIIHYLYKLTKKYLQTDEDIALDMSNFISSFPEEKKGKALRELIDYFITSLGDSDSPEMKLRKLVFMS